MFADQVDAARRAESGRVRSCPAAPARQQQEQAAEASMNEAGVEIHIARR